MTGFAKSHIVRTKTEFNFIATVYTDTHNIYPSPVYEVLNVNWFAFLKGILLTLQSHSRNNGTHGGHKLGSGELDLLPLTMWRTGVSLATVWVLWLLMGCSKQGFLSPPTPPCPTSQHPATHPIHPSLLAILTAERDSKKYHEIQSSEIEKVGYNKSQ